MFHSSHDMPSEGATRAAGDPIFPPAILATVFVSAVNGAHGTQSGAAATMRVAAFGILALGLCLAAGCLQQMANQPRVETLEPSAFFEDGQGARPPIPGTIPFRGDPQAAVRHEPAATGAILASSPADTRRPPVTRELLERGQQRYGIYCDHCHGFAGYGDGMVVQRGFPQPPSYHIDRLRNATDEHLYNVVTNGLGRMPAFGLRIPLQDRWAIVSYVRALQLSQYATVDELPESDRAQLPPPNQRRPETTDSANEQS